MLAHRLRNRLSLQSTPLSQIASSTNQIEYTDHSNSSITKIKKFIKGGDTIGRRLLSLIYPKRSAFFEINKWKNEGKTTSKYQLTCAIRELRKLKRYKHALEVCEWMTRQPELKLLPGDYAVHLDIVGKMHGIESAEKFFNDLPENLKAQSTCTSLLNIYVQSKMSDKAESLMNKMSIQGLLKCALPYNHMLNLYISEGEYEKVEELVMELKRNTLPNEFTYNLWLKACANTNDVKNAENVVMEMKERNVKPDWVTFSTLASLYTKANKLKKAKEALLEMEKRISRKEREGYSSLISLYANVLDRESVYRIWDKMKLMFRKLSDDEYKCMLSSLTKLGDIKEAESIYEEWEMVSGTKDCRTPNIVLAYYVRNRMIEKAESFHAHIMEAEIEQSYTTWELMAWGYLRESKMDKVLECLKKAFALLGKWKPDTAIVRAVFDELEKEGNVEDGEEFLVMLRGVGFVTTETYNCLLRVYLKARVMPLIVEERMENDGVALDDDTRCLLKGTKGFGIATSVSTLIF